jgi:hypothetical protein
MKPRSRKSEKKRRNGKKVTVKNWRKRPEMPTLPSSPSWAKVNRWNDILYFILLPVYCIDSSSESILFFRIQVV